MGEEELTPTRWGEIEERLKWISRGWLVFCVCGWR